MFARQSVCSRNVGNDRQYDEGRDGPCAYEVRTRGFDEDFFDDSVITEDRCDPVEVLETVSTSNASWQRSRGPDTRRFPDAAGWRR
jgi:hypothetical protein